VPPGDWVEMDELCVRLSPSLWLWVAVSHLTRLVLGFVVADRSDAALSRLVEEELHWAWRDALVRTDGWEGYQRLLPAERHQVCSKGSGLTSIVEALNCKWRQTQSALARKSCGVSRDIVDDVTERFVIAVDRHNRRCLDHWNRHQATRTPTTMLSP
jgi:IS1 family transposase